MPVKFHCLLIPVVATLFGVTLSIAGDIDTKAPHATSLSMANLRSVDVMKYTKDVMSHQLTDERIKNLVATLKMLDINYIALAIPMDASADYPEGNKPAPRDAYVFTQKWADAVHAQGLHILWRGTWSGLEGINGFPKLVGDKRFPAGTADSAPKDGDATWLGKTWRYIVDNPRFFEAGDIWAPLPERTEDIFQDARSFLPYTGAGIQANYSNFFTDLKQVSEMAFAKIGKPVICGLTTNNYTEVKSGWIPQSLYDAQAFTVIDYYGSNHSPGEMESDIRQMYTMHKKPVFVQEWSDYWNSQLSPSGRTAYLNQIYAILLKLSGEGVLVGFNYWGGWDNTTESVITEDAGGFHLNYRGELLRDFFRKCKASNVKQPGNVAGKIP